MKILQISNFMKILQISNFIKILQISNFMKILQISNFMKILPVGGRVDPREQIDMTKLIVAFRNFANSPTN